METPNENSQMKDLTPHVQTKIVDTIISRLLELNDGLGDCINYIDTLQECAVQSDDHYNLPKEKQHELAIFCNQLRTLFAISGDISDKIGNEFVILVAPLKDVEQYLNAVDSTAKLFTQAKSDLN